MVTFASTPDDLRPPHPPWRQLDAQTVRGGYLSCYLSDELSPLPVRAVTRHRDNKSDPNLETGTYGLFSTCSKQMRQGIVNHRRGHVIFLTRHGGQRVISGYYRVGWYAPTGFAPQDFSLAASHAHFVAKPVPFKDVSQEFGLRYSRLCLCLTPEQTSSLVTLLDQQPDATNAYIREIHRLEHFNLSAAGKRYVNFGRIRSFDWSDAARVLGGINPPVDTNVVANSSLSGWWECRECAHRFRSGALLKLCPHCQKFGSLQPLPFP